MAKKSKLSSAGSTAKPAQGTTKKLSIDKITCSQHIQPRVKTDESVVEEYAERIEAGDKFPPIVVYYDGTTYWLVAGFHRLAAYKKLGRKQVECIIIDGSKEDAQWAAFQSNKGHGLRPTNADKRRAVTMVFAHPNGKKMSDRAIGDLVGVSATTVAKYRPKAKSTANNGQSETRVGRDGRVTNTAKIGKDKKKAGATPETKAGDKQNGKVEKVSTLQAGGAAENPADVAVDGDERVEVYHRMLKNLPPMLDELVEFKDDIVGKAMDSESARKALAHILSRILVLQDAEAKPGKKKSGRARTKTSDNEPW